MYIFSIVGCDCLAFIYFSVKCIFVINADYVLFFIIMICHR